MFNIYVLYDKEYREPFKYFATEEAMQRYLDKPYITSDVKFTARLVRTASKGATNYDFIYDVITVEE